MLVHSQLVPLAFLPDFLPLHDILPQDLGDALGMFEGLSGFEGTWFEMRAGAERLASEGARGGEGRFVACLTWLERVLSQHVNDRRTGEGETSCAQ